MILMYIVIKCYYLESQALEQTNKDIIFLENWPGSVQV